MKKLLLLLLCLQIAVSPTAQVYSQTNPEKFRTMNEDEKREFLSNIQTAYARQLEFHQPYLMDIAKAELPQGWTPGYKGPQSHLDQDPFFMRSQEWASTGAKSAKPGFSFSKDSNGFLTLREATWGKTLTIKERITSIFETTEYIVLSVDLKNDLFERKMGGDPERGEGVFFINKADFYVQAKRADSKSVPVFFFPLPDIGWKGIKEGFEWRSTDQIVLFNQSGSALPVDLVDFKAIEKIQRNHLKYAEIFAVYAMNEQERSQVIQSGEMPLPMPGTTAGFGLFWTSQTPAQMASVNKSFSNQFFAQLQNLVLPQAHADLMEMASSLLTPDLAHRVSFLLQIMGGTFVGAMALKYTVYWKTFKEKYPLAEVIKDTNQATGAFMLPMQLLAREAKGIFDVYSHVLSTTINGASVTIVTALEFLLDRYLTSSAGPSNGLVRKIFNNTFGFTRGQIDKLAMNWKTFWLGVGVLGSIDCALVVLQLLFVTPMLLHALGLSAVMEGPAVAAMITAELIRNFVGYWMNGSFSYSADQKYFVQTEVEQMVNNQLRAEGFDPDSKEVRGRKEKMMNDLFDSKMTQMGLPSQEHFLFDANTVTQDVAALAGYGVKKDTKEKFKDVSGSFLFEKGRWGLVKPALYKAIAAAEKLNQEAPSNERREGLAILKETESQYGFVMNFIKGTMRVFQSDEAIVKKRAEEFEGGAAKYLLNFSRDLVKAISRETIEKTRAVRQALTLLSYSGDVKEVINELPGQWKDLGSKNPEAQRYAADLYSMALTSITESASDKKNKEIGGYEKSQYAWARKVTEQELVREFDGQNKSWNQEDYQKSFSRNLAQKVGLIVERVENSKFVEKVYAKANETTALELKQAAHQGAMKELDEMDKAAYQAQAFSKHFLSTYIQLSTMSDEHLPADSVEQPGRFQGLRKKIVGMKGEKYIRGMLRVAEGFFKDDQYKVGLNAAWKRNVPVLPDLWGNIVKKARSAPYMMMFGYFTAYYIWQQQQDYGIYLLGLTMFPPLNTIAEIYNRVNRMLGIKPMGDTWSKAKWAFIWSWIGYPLFIPQTLLTGPAKDGFDQGIRQPFLRTVRSCKDALSL